MPPDDWPTHGWVGTPIDRLRPPRGAVAQPRTSSRRRPSLRWARLAESKGPIDRRRFSRTPLVPSRAARVARRGRGRQQAPSPSDAVIAAHGAGGSAADVKGWCTRTRRAVAAAAAAAAAWAASSTTFRACFHIPAVVLPGGVLGAVFGGASRGERGGQGGA